MDDAPTPPNDERLEPRDYGYGPGYAANETTPSSSLRRYVEVIRRRWWTIVGVFCLFVAVGTLRAFRAPNVYQATAKLIIERGGPRIANIGGIVENTPWWDPDYYKTQTQLVTSRAVMEEALGDPAVSNLFAAAQDPAAPPPGRSLFGELRRTLIALLGGQPSAPAEPWQRLRSTVRARHLSGSHFLQIESRGGDPARCARIVNAVARAFARHHLAEKVEFHGEAFRFLQEEQRKQEQALREAERALQAFREGSAAVTVAGGENEQPLLKRLDELNREITDTQLERIDLTARIRVVQDLLQGIGTLDTNTVSTLLAVPGIGDQSEVAEAQKNVAAARRRLAELGRLYGAQHPQLKAAAEDLASARRDLETALGRTVQAMTNRELSLQEKERELAREVEEQKGEALHLAKEMLDFNRLNNEVQRHTRLFDMLVERMREVDVSSGFVRTSVQIAEFADTPRAPVSPRRGRMVLWAVFLGLAAGIGLSFFFESLDDAVKTPEDLKEKLGVPLLGFVPEIRTDGHSAKERFKFRGTVLLRDDVTSIAEAYRSMRTGLFFSAPEGEMKVVALTSCGPSEGKTTTAANLATAIAKSGKRVLLIDCDLHRPSIHRLFGIVASPGLTDVLVGATTLEDALHRVVPLDHPVENLHVLAAGSMTPSPGDLLGSRRMADTVAQLREMYDWVVIDTPPVLFVSDAGILGTYCDGAILVVKASKHRGAVLQRAREHLEMVNTRLVGCILNQLVVSRVGRYYSSYYYHGYSRYADDYRAHYYGEETEGAAPGSRRTGGGPARGPRR